jgi:hypothetical protein
MKSKTAFAALAATLALCLPANADSLPMATYNGWIGATVYDYPNPDLTAIVQITGPGRVLTAVTDAYSFPVSNTFADVVIDPFTMVWTVGRTEVPGSVTADISFAYWFSITAPTTTIVPVNLTATGNFTGQFGQSYLDIFSYTGFYGNILHLGTDSDNPGV